MPSFTDFNLGEEYGLWSQSAWIQIWPLPLTSCVILGKMTYLYKMAVRNKGVRIC